MIPKFYVHVRVVYLEGDLALFETPCMICRKPMLFTHKDTNWKDEIKPTLMTAFKRWFRGSSLVI